MKTENNMKY